MKINEVIDTLQKLKDKHGNLPVLEAYNAIGINCIDYTTYSDSNGEHDFIGIEFTDLIDEDA